MAYAGQGGFGDVVLHPDFAENGLVYYGYPLVSNGDHYSGESIPDHDTRAELAAPTARSECSRISGADRAGGCCG